MERNYFDELMSEVKGEGVTLTTVAANVTIEIAKLNVALKKLWEVLVKKGYVTEDDKTELNANIRKTFSEMLRAAAEKHPELGKEVEKFKKEYP